jgi:four helix bundle protein
MGARNIKQTLLSSLIYAHASCDETILHLSFIKNTHDVNEKGIQLFLDAYDELGSKINRFIKYVEKEWK